MDTKKKTMAGAAALLVAIGAAYPLYRYATHKAPGEADMLARAPGTQPGSGDSGPDLFDGSGVGLSASGKALTANDPASISGFGGPVSGSLDSEISSAPASSASGAVAPPVGKPSRGPGTAGSGAGFEPGGWQSGSAGTVGGATFGGGGAKSAAGSGAKKTKSPGKAGKSAPSRGSIAGLPAELFAGKMTDAQSDDLSKRFKEGKLSAFQIDSLIGLVNEGREFTEKQAQVLRDIRAKDDKQILDAMAAAENTPVQFPQDMEIQRGRYWPVKGRVSQKFGCTNWNVYSGRMYNGVWCPHFHNGLDIAAPQGTPLHAFDAGQVTAVGGTQSSGVYVVIAHPDGLATTYFHMPVGGPTVRRGQYVTANQVVGSVGMTGMTTGPHLHFMARKGDVIDPLSVLP